MSSTEERLAAALADCYRIELQTVPSLWKAGALRLSPGFASLRNDPRFVKLLESWPK